jgi:transcriptional regulator with XRE-family HTH domain
MTLNREVNVLEDIRVNLRNVIKDKGIKQASIALKVGMTPNKLSQIVNLERKLDANEMFAICEAIGITPGELYEYSSANGN